MGRGLNMGKRNYYWNKEWKLISIPYFLKFTNKNISSLPTEISNLRNSLITANAWLKREIDTLKGEIDGLVIEINAQQVEIANEAKNEKAWDNEAEISATQDLRRLPWEALAASLNVIKGSSLYIAGTAYQVVDSTLFNSVTELTKIFGTDINSIANRPFQLGRQTGNNAVTAVAIVAMAGWGGAGTAWATAAITGTAICAGTLAWGGIILFPCAIEIGTASAVAAGWAAVASYGWVMYAISSKNQAGIQKAVEGARWSASKIQWSKVPKPDLSKITNSNLKSVLEKDYREGATIWNGSTADAIRSELATWNPVWWVFHSTKWQEILNGIQKRFNANDLNNYDKKISTDIFNDITNALNGK